MIKVLKYAPYLEYNWERVAQNKVINMEFKSMEELEIFRDSLEAEYIDDRNESKVRILMEYIEYE